MPRNQTAAMEMQLEGMGLLETCEFKGTQSTSACWMHVCTQMMVENRCSKVIGWLTRAMCTSPTDGAILLQLQVLQSEHNSLAKASPYHLQPIEERSCRARCGECFCGGAVVRPWRYLCRRRTMVSRHVWRGTRMQRPGSRLPRSGDMHRVAHA